MCILTVSLKIQFNDLCRHSNDEKDGEIHQFVEVEVIVVETMGDVEGTAWKCALLVITAYWT